MDLDQMCADALVRLNAELDHAVYDAHCAISRASYKARSSVTLSPSRFVFLEPYASKIICIDDIQTRSRAFSRQELIPNIISIGDLPVLQGHTVFTSNVLRLLWRGTGIPAKLSKFWNTVMWGTNGR